MLLGSHTGESWNFSRTSVRLSASRPSTPRGQADSEVKHQLQVTKLRHNSQSCQEGFSPGGHARRGAAVELRAPRESVCRERPGVPPSHRGLYAAAAGGDCPLRVRSPTTGLLWEPMRDGDGGLAVLPFDDPFRSAFLFASGGSAGGDSPDSGCERRPLDLSA